MTDSGFNNQSTVNIGLVAMVEWRCGSYQPYGECKWESEQSYYACPEECPPKPLFAMCRGEQYHHYITGGYDNRYCQAFMDGILRSHAHSPTCSRVCKGHNLTHYQRTSSCSTVSSINVIWAKLPPRWKSHGPNCHHMFHVSFIIWIATCFSAFRKTKPTEQSQDPVWTSDCSPHNSRTACGSRLHIFLLCSDADMLCIFPPFSPPVLVRPCKPH